MVSSGNKEAEIDGHGDEGDDECEEAQEGGEEVAEALGEGGYEECKEGNPCCVSALFAVNQGGQGMGQ